MSRCGKGDMRFARRTRDFLQVILLHNLALSRLPLVVAALATVDCVASCGDASAHEKPNIVFVIADNVIFQVASSKHLPEIVSLLADDRLGASREECGDDLHEDYLAAYEEIRNDANNELIVAIATGTVIATLQITYIPSLTHMGARRATLEGVRVSTAYRGSGIGTRLIQWVIQRCRSRGCRLVQLTSDRTRTDALAFYSKLGFEDTHAGMKLWLD